MTKDKEFMFTNNTSIYTQDKKQNETAQTIAYTLSGSHALSEDSDLLTINNEQVCAKIVHRIDATKKYMIRLDSNNKFFNPVSIYGTEKNKTFLDRICRSNQKFSEVSEKVFSLYTKFLSTKNILWLNNAEREAE
jgi:hypothetical protein